MSRSSVAIVGAGSQGRRLAYMWSSQGKDVYLIDSQKHQLEASLSDIDKLRSSRPQEVPYGQIFTELPDALGTVLQNTWLVVECVPEQISLKRQVLSQLDTLAPEDTIIASNSSSYTCSEIVSGLTLKKESRVLSAHTYWPPEVSAIEIMGHEKTDPMCVDIVLKQCAAHGFMPYHVKVSSMGYLYNRIWAAIKREALLIAAEGAGSPEEIDSIFKEVLKTPKGPFELMDVVGLDVVLDIEQHYAAARQGVPDEPRKFLNEYLEQGFLGMKSGRGFYEYKV